MTHYIARKAITPSVLAAANKFIHKGKLNPKTFGEGALVGFLAEIFMEEIYSAIFPDSELIVVADKSFDYDMLLDGNRIDIKSKKRTVPLAPFHDISIADYTTKQQDCQTYAFCSIRLDRVSKVPLEFYYAGYMGKREYLKQAVFKRKGEPDGGNLKPDGSEFLIVEDCWNLKYSQLHQYELDVLKGLKAQGYTLQPFN